MSTKRKPFAVLDLETDPFKAGRLPRPFAAGFYNGDYPSLYWGDDCIKYLIEDLKEYDGYVYAHNGGKFDFHFLLPYLPRSALNKSIRIINGRIVEFRIGKARLRDSWNILPVPLARLAKDEIDYKKLEPDIRHKYMAEIREYLYSDCKHLRDNIIRFINEYGLHLTIPSAAFRN